MDKFDFDAFLDEVHDIASKNVRKNQLKADVQLQRMVSQKFYNPFDVLLLEPEATETEIDKQYRNFARLLHPDRNKDPRAKEAFQMCERAVKALRDPQKRMVYVRVMKQGYERARYERDKKDKKRVKAGLSALPEDSFDSEYRTTYKKIFEDIDQRKKHIEKAKENSFKTRAEEEERLRTMEQYRILTQEEWEKTREDRVSNWRSFQKKKGMIGTKRSNFGIRTVAYVPETRIKESEQADEI